MYYSSNIINRDGKMKTDEETLEEQHNDLMLVIDKNFKGNLSEREWFKKGTDNGIIIGIQLVRDRLLKLNTSETFAKNFIISLENKNIEDKEEQIRELFKLLYEGFIETGKQYTGITEEHKEWNW